MPNGSNMILGKNAQAERPAQPVRSSLLFGGHADLAGGR